MDELITTSAEKAAAINTTIGIGKKLNLDTNLISDGYHTFGELYEHRIELFITICKIICDFYKIGLISSTTPGDLCVWRSLKHSDGSGFDGWFILGIAKAKGEQITYHLPMSKWDRCLFAEELELAPEWDGHTANDVLERLKLL
jgi:hypothetical protein